MLATCGLLMPAERGLAQHASDDPVAAADDGFGLTQGLESIGLYSPGSIRGFNPQAAGNVRIDGLYFDQQGGLSNRVVEGSTIRVGISETGYAFPAPTGIVDYDLRHVGNGDPSGSAVLTVGPFQGRDTALTASRLSGRARSSCRSASAIRSVWEATGLDQKSRAIHRATGTSERRRT